MKFVLKTFLSMLLAAIFQLFSPWYIVMVLTFLINLILPGKNWRAFLSGFTGIGLLWLFYAIYIDVSNGFTLSERVIKLFPLPDSPTWLVVVTALVGGIAGAFGAISGNSIGLLFKKEQ